MDPHACRPLLIDEPAVLTRRQAGNDALQFFQRRRVLRHLEGIAHALRPILRRRTSLIAKESRNEVKATAAAVTNTGCKAPTKAPYRPRAPARQRRDGGRIAQDGPARERPDGCWPPAHRRRCRRTAPRPPNRRRTEQRGPRGGHAQMLVIDRVLHGEDQDLHHHAQPHAEDQHVSGRHHASVPTPRWKEKQRGRHERRAADGKQLVAADAADDLAARQIEVKSTPAIIGVRCRPAMAGSAPFTT